ncbi:sigma 54-interacting transcriptional regulator [Dokdonella soli]|uniref:sigma 54-interacting transcriptional regulator n=1 Tax=Dokdonella soli TaxID=529810 RepID=UPI00360605EA
MNCATLRGDGAMSTLFGHVKGAYAGAGSDRAGLALGLTGRPSSRTAAGGNCRCHQMRTGQSLSVYVPSPSSPSWL